MTAISFVSGVVMVWIFGKVSDQDTIRQVRERIRGNLIGVRLFQSDIGVVLQLQRRIFGDTFSYMRYALVPMVVLLVPVVLIMTQLNLRFAARPLEPGESAVIKAYPPLELGAFGWSINCLVAFFVLSLGFGFAFKGTLGVEV